MPKTRMPRAVAATRVTPEKWAEVRAAVRDAADRFADLTLSVPDPSVLATKDWTVADTAAHTTGIAMNYTAMVDENGRPLPIPAVREHFPVTTVDTIATGLNVAQLGDFTERDPKVLARMLRESIEDILRTTENADPGRIIPWLGDSRLPLAGILAHMTNELLIHGWDIARATGIPWRIPEEQAALFFDLFVVEVIRNGYGHLLDSDGPVRKGRIVVEFRSDHTTPVTMVLEDGVATVEDVGGDYDVRIRFRPATMNLLRFHRIGYPKAMLSGSLMARGKLWLLPAFLRKVRMP